MKRILLAAVLAVASFLAACGGGGDVADNASVAKVVKARTADTLDIPQADIDAIAQQQQMPSDAIAQWLSANNGNQLYQTYLDKYKNVPADQKWQAVNRTQYLPGTSTPTYMYYVERVQGLNTYDCAKYAADTTDIKSEALCALGYWNIFQQSLVEGTADTVARAAWSTLLTDMAPKVTSSNTFDLPTNAVLSSVFSRAVKFEVNNTKYQTARVNALNRTESLQQKQQTEAGWLHPTDPFTLFALWDQYTLWEAPMADDLGPTYTPCGPTIRIPSWSPSRVFFDCGISYLSNHQSAYDLDYWTILTPTTGSNTVYATAVQTDLNIVSASVLYSIAKPSPQTFLATLPAKWTNYVQNDTLFIHQMVAQYPTVPVIQ